MAFQFCYKIISIGFTFAAWYFTGRSQNKSLCCSKRFFILFFHSFLYHSSHIFLLGSIMLDLSLVLYIFQNIATYCRSLKLPWISIVGFGYIWPSCLLNMLSASWGIFLHTLHSSGRYKRPKTFRWNQYDIGTAIRADCSSKVPSKLRLDSRAVWKLFYHIFDHAIRRFLFPFISF